ncbi:MAG: undecaprenyldiphospho-muramoylpentapeptide beta-N-acetylglucosaminyltransferase [Marinilabiliaceae bacterium]|nr:undecaprenyldiphospho-muramoylpentapeptide beta-N-acetylglucosaminyltransferase [Marinilabiliaceae bacterium]
MNSVTNYKTENNKSNSLIKSNVEKIIISGGGTGGHIFPALAIADAIKLLKPEIEILFVGAKGRMEMIRIPEAGYKIVGLPVAGFQRKLSFGNIIKNFVALYKLPICLFLAKKIIKQYKPAIVIGVGGYASGPIMRAAAKRKIPTMIQEQNSYPGITNKLLSKKAIKICVAYPEMERFFAKEKIIFTGNPIRKILLNKVDKEKAYSEFRLDPNKKTILVLGGSLGAKSINEGIKENINLLKDSDIQMIWQTGNNYIEEMKHIVKTLKIKNIKVLPFIRCMDLAYQIADVVVSRAGAGTISELALLRKATILVPSPNVAEDHQTKNAMRLVNKNAAILVKDSETKEKLLPQTLELINNETIQEKLRKNIIEFAKPNADEEIAKVAMNIIETAH